MRLRHISYILFCLFVFCGSLFAAEPPKLSEEEQYEIQKLYEQAVDAHEAGNMDKAVELFSTVINRNPNYSDAYWYRGSIYGQQEKLDLAIADMRQVNRLAPELAQAYGNLGWYLILQGRFEEAKEACQEAYEFDKENYAWTVNLGHAYLLSKDENTAHKYYERTLELLKNAVDLTKGPVADFELFIQKNWQVAASKREKNWMISNMEKRKYELTTKPNLVIQLGHSKSVWAAAISVDNRYVLSGSQDNTLKLWDVSSGSEIRTFHGHSDVITTVQFSRDGRYALSGSHDYNLLLWDISTGEKIRTFTGHTDGINVVTFSSDGRYALSGSDDGTLRLWDIERGVEIRKFEGHSYWTSSAAFSPDGKYALSGGGDNIVRLWEISTGKKVKDFKGHSGSVSSVAFSPDGKYVLSSSRDGTVKLWDISVGKIVRTFVIHSKVGRLRDSEVKIAAFSPDGRYVFGSSKEILKCWDIKTGAEIRQLRKYSDAVSIVAISFDGKYVLSTSDDNDRKLQMWDINTCAEIRSFTGLSLNGVSSVGVSHDGKYALAGAIWDVSTGEPLKDFPGSLDSDVLKALSSDGRYALSGSSDGLFRLWDVQKNMEITRFKEPSDTVRAVAISPDNRYALSGSDDRTIKLWSLNTGKRIRTFKGHTQGVLGLGVSSVAFSPDGKYALSSGGDQTIRLWNINNGKQSRILGNPRFVSFFSFAFKNADIASSVAFSPDGRYALSGSADTTLKLWDLNTGKKIRTFKGHSSPVDSVTFSSDGRHALSGSSDKTLKLWDINTGKRIRTFIGHSGEVKSVAFSRDGRFALSCSEDKTAIIWDITTGKWLAKLITFTDGTWAVVDPEGRFDTNNLEEIKGLHWIMLDDPLTPLPIETFMKDYYEPRLLPRILNGDKFKPVKDLMTLNRVLPTVTISSITREGKGDTVTVAVEVAGQKRKVGDKDRETGVADLKLFRAGQLVGFREGKIELKDDGKQVITFSGIRLPRKAGTKEVEFSAYAFNDDGIKSLTSRTSFAMPADITPVRGKAYLVTIGVNRYQNSEWNLNYAASDAIKIRQSLETRIPKDGSYTELIPVTLTDELATKQHIKAVFDLLAGNPVAPELKKQIPNSDRLAKATPEDLLIISFSGHGYVDDKGIFYSFTHDTGEGSGKVVTTDLLAHIISSDELSRWLRYVDAGDMAMIVDACHSAATVGDSFKPGPMGSRGLGQLAFDKGMKILAASQADDFALESEKLQQGLLSYALVHDGIEALQADYKPADKAILLGEWLSYGVERVPKLYQEVKSGKVQSFNKGDKSRGEVIYMGDKVNSSLKKKHDFQQPSLFDFSRKKTDAVVTRLP